MKKLLLFLCMALTLSLGARAQSYAWPANWEGVMLQGFYWDSYSDSKWTKLTSQADELSQYFKLIWVPNSGKAGGGNQMGYMPQYWFSNHNSSFGTEAELRTMISTFKAKGTGIIEDVVINHRNGVSGWYDFPTETWNGQTWHIGLDGICSNDNLAGSGHGTPTGARDTGESFDGCRDLDHTNANVQNNCKNYCKFLIDDLGYAGFRLDMVKGYSGKYTKMYNEYSKPTYCVGEYWDGNYDAVKAWIESTGRQSAAFDFPFKYAVNEAFSSNDMTKLVWLAGYSTPQPAGMIHYEYQRYAVTFIDNHDTYGDSWNKFNGNVVAANAFMLCSPGTPCVFLPHYKQYKSEIQALINVRNSVGVHNMSAVKVLKSERDCYMAEVSGSKGKLVVKVGSSMVSPDGYTNADIKATGNGYCVWTKTNVTGGNVSTPDTPNTVTGGSMWILGNLKGAAGWGATPGTGVAMTANGSKYIAKNVEFVLATGETKCYFNLTDYVGATWDDLNMGANRYGSTTEGAPVTVGTPAKVTAYLNDVDASGCLSWTVAPGTYDVTFDASAMTILLSEPGTTPDPVDPTPVDPTPATGTVNVYLDGAWTGVYAYIYNESGASVVENASWPGVAMAKDAETGYWKITVPDNLKNSSQVIFNTGLTGSNRYPADMEPGLPIAGKSMIFKVSDKSWTEYTEPTPVDPDPVDPDPVDPDPVDPTPSDYPDLYIVGYAYGINAPTDYKMERDGAIYTISMTDLSAAFAIAGVGLNPFITTANREMVVNTEYVCDSSEKQLMYFPAKPKNVVIRLNYDTKVLTVSAADGVEAIEGASDAAPVFFNLQGVRVDNPVSNQVYIMIQAGKASKVIVK